jgi:hypothetical protein
MAHAREGAFAGDAILQRRIKLDPWRCPRRMLSRKAKAQAVTRSPDEATGPSCRRADGFSLALGRKATPAAIIPNMAIRNSDVIVQAMGTPPVTHAMDDTTEGAARQRARSGSRTEPTGEITTRRPLGCPAAAQTIVRLLLRDRGPRQRQLLDRPPWVVLHLARRVTRSFSMVRGPCVGLSPTLPRGWGLPTRVGRFTFVRGGRPRGG